MKKLVVVTAVIAGLVAPVGSAAAEPLAAPVSTPVATTSVVTPVGSWSEDLFCAVIKFLKGGWAGRPTDCSF
ncbi:hypothetical protein [Nocardia araoensis]|uniref:hypothetical protein n=1 Tax=Nocardia araoensis TaxID=228600 RepID=UPI0002DAAB61|nr:hypothetical protein [Nocardia araoensis]